MKVLRLCMTAAFAALFGLSVYGADNKSLSLPEKSGFPFVIKALAADSPLSAAFLNDHVAGSRGRVRAGEDGHLWLGDTRVRFMGLNCTSIPEKQQAPDLARRLAALGINIIRFHHIDASWGKSLLWSTAGKSRAVLDPVMLDRLDFFIAELEKNGIYINLNLLTGRQFSSFDGLPAAVDKLANFKARHVPGFWNKAFMDAQKDYARQLLTHKNPYTGKTYIDDPALAVVEINNENGLLQAWLSQWMDDMDDSLLVDLRSGWNRWLKARYGTGAALSATLKLSEPLGAEILKPLLVSDRPANWNLEQHEGAKARIVPLAGRNGVRLEVLSTGSAGWHVQYNCSPLNLVRDQMYTLEFKARSAGSGPAALRKLEVGIGMAHEPWQGLGFGRLVELDGSWKTFTMVIPSLGLSDSNARLNFSGLGLVAGALEIADVSLKTGGNLLSDGADLDAGTFSVPKARERESMHPELRRQWMDYLYATEDAYWGGMLSYLRRDLGLKSMVAGTIVGCSPPSLMNRFDFVDAHAYWNHPAFPGTEWDGNNYWVSNSSLVRDTKGGTLSELAFKRVLGKPFSVSEYDHPWPNQYGMEMYLMLSVFACFQDWDMLYGFTMDGEPLAGPHRIAGFFDQTGNPLKAGALPFAARIFRQGLVAPGATLVALPFTVQAERDMLAESYAWNLFDLGQLGVPRELPLAYRMGTAIIGAQTATAGRSTNGSSGSSGSSAGAARSAVKKLLDELPPRTAGDFEGGQIFWDAPAGRFSVHADALLAGIRVEARGSSPAWNAPAPSFELESPLWGVRARTTDNPACLVLLAANPKKDSSLIAFTGRLAGNSREGLTEYKGPRKRGVPLAENPLDLDKVNAAALADSTRSWALGTLWDFRVPGRPTLAPLDQTGLPFGPKVAGKTDPADCSLWYLLE